MKYGAFYSLSRNKNNVGDSIIDLALLNIYNTMEIKEEDIIRLSPRDMPNYKGEKILMPIVSPLPSFPIISRAFSKDIIPIFICFVLYGPLPVCDIEFLKEYQPIGCRDEYTYRELLKHGINAYINGCITVTFSKLSESERELTGRKVILCDVQPELMRYIPENLKNGAISISHIKENDSTIDPIEDAKAYYKMYRERAGLVITSKLHAASPCLAMGIPCVFAKNEFSHRFSWIDRCIHVYDQSEYQSIDWNPDIFDVEDLKNDVIKLVSLRIKGSNDFVKLSKKLTEFYLQRKKKKCITSLSKVVPFLDKRFKDGKVKTYSLWSITTVSSDIYTYVSENYPKAKLVHVYDKFRTEEFCGVISEPLENIKYADEDLLIACPFNEAVLDQMKNSLEKHNISKDKYIIAFAEP